MITHLFFKLYLISLLYIPTILYKQIGTNNYYHKQTNQTIMSKITTLLILLIAAATSSSASNSSIESKAEEDSVAKSSLVIDKSSGKLNNKDWSFEEFENTMEVRLYVCLELAERLWRFYVHIIYVTYLI